MADKTWTATDLQMGKLGVNVIDGILYLERRYVFLDTNGDVLEQIAGGRVTDVIAWADVPANIKTALADVDTWTKNKALTQEGMT